VPAPQMFSPPVGAVVVFTLCVISAANHVAFKPPPASFGLVALIPVYLGSVGPPQIGISPTSPPGDPGDKRLREAVAASGELQPRGLVPGDLLYEQRAGVRGE